jgi:hypothetical protein
MSRGLSMAMFEDTDISLGLVDFVLVAPVDHEGLPPMPTAS